MAISIHALREEGDPKRSETQWTESKISIHALREEGDAALSDALPVHNVFLSTPSARRATFLRVSTARRFGNFYPRPPRGGRLQAALSVM